ncbi:transglycosylase [Sphingorhabdus lutea]|uniref:Transglycosylase n=1 Tax=Sphingorhabdus lutea TaxID=1913578 RepID=A0A1L3JEI3_9SPHN|nr:transglycosylase [Sphingorhabdus lutea]
MPKAHADIMEIGEDGPRWIAGPYVAVHIVNEFSGEGQAFELGEDYVLPNNAYVYPAMLRDKIPPQYAAKVHELAARFDLSPTLIEALIWQESRWKHNALSPAGARGLAQLMPGTAREMGVNPDDPFANLEGGARYLRQQLDRFDGNIEKALAAYNAGPKRVIQANGIPQIKETQNYVGSIINRLSDHMRSNHQ